MTKVENSCSCGGCHCHSHQHSHSHDYCQGNGKLALMRIIVASLLTIALQFLPDSAFPQDGWVRFVFFFSVYLLIGWNVLKEAFHGILHGEFFDENFLMTLATAGAFGLAIYEGSGDYNEAIAVMLFFQVGEYFQNYAVAKSRKNISKLMDIRPDYANLKVDNGLERVNPETVAVGSIIVVQPGEKVPIDGVIVEGNSSLNTSVLTGESVPREVKTGDEIFSGCINLSGVLHVKTTKVFGESTISKILQMVEHTSSNKSTSETLISRFAHYYTPVVCYSALALVVFPPLIRGFILGLSPEWSEWLYHALTFLVISCPCALVISIPLSFYAGIGGASRAGILIKGANFLEALSKVKTVVLDKTGTLTLGVFEVNSIHHSGYDEEHHECRCGKCSGGASEEANVRLLELAALAECSSSHPISKSIQKAYGKPIDHSRVRMIKEEFGYGVTAEVDGIKVIAGNEKLMTKFGIQYSHCGCSGTIVHIALDGEYAGHIVMGDVEKKHAKEGVSALREIGVEHLIMLTGDDEIVAKEMANRLGIEMVYSQLLPNDKVEKLDELKSQFGIDKNNQLAFVGDGVNDAPVLSCADVGIAMGGMGSDAAIEAADVVLMDDEPLNISKAMRISKKTLNIVWQNIIFALSVKLLFLILSIFGMVNMWLAIFADDGIMIIAVLNAFRALYVKRT